mgnify:CR=1 FL=1
MATVLCSATNGPHEYACAYCQEPIPLGKAISAPIITELPEPTIVHRSVRYRVNVSISTKGQKVWDCTCDAEGCDTVLCGETICVDSHLDAHGQGKQYARDVRGY